MTEEEAMTGIILFAHGSRVEEANRGVHELARQIESAGPYPYARAAFLDLAQPDLSAAVLMAMESGLRRVVVIPYFLVMGVHLRRDLPMLVGTAKGKYPDFKVEVGQSLEGHPLMPSIVLGRVQEVLEGNKTPQ